jgi:hypothetical protein
MKMAAIFKYAILLAFISAAIFGLYLPTASHSNHEAICPFATGAALPCGTTLEHIGNWQKAFTALLVELILASFVFLVIQENHRELTRNAIPKSYRFRRTPEPQTAFQLLFSRGIIHPKAP